MHKVFISYHHDNDQPYKEALSQAYGQGHDKMFIDASVDTGGIADGLPAETVRTKIRDEYLRDSTITILLVGTETKKRKHIDWELYSSMHDGSVNKKSGILVITLPSVSPKGIHVTYGQEEKGIVHPDIDSWTTISGKEGYRRRYPYMPERIIDQLASDEALVSIMPWSKVNRQNIDFLISKTHENRAQCKYDLSTPLRRQNA